MVNIPADILANASDMDLMAILKDPNADPNTIALIRSELQKRQAAVIQGAMRLPTEEPPSTIPNVPAPEFIQSLTAYMQPPNPYAERPIPQSLGLGISPTASTPQLSGYSRGDVHKGMSLSPIEQILQQVMNPRIEENPRGTTQAEGDFSQFYEQLAQMDQGSESPLDFESIFGQAKELLGQEPALGESEQFLLDEYKRMREEEEQFDYPLGDEYSLPLVQAGLAMAAAASNTDNFLEALTMGAQSGLQSYVGLQEAAKEFEKEQRAERLTAAQGAAEVERSLREESRAINAAAIEGALAISGQRLDNKKFELDLAKFDLDVQRAEDYARYLQAQVANMDNTEIAGAREVDVEGKDGKPVRMTMLVLKTGEVRYTDVTGIAQFFNATGKATPTIYDYMAKDPMAVLEYAAEQGLTNPDGTTVSTPEEAFSAVLQTPFYAGTQ